MIDLHSHLLPGIDDGAPDVDTAIRLANIAADDGITHMVCTPHIHPGYYDNTVATIHAAKIRLTTALKKNKITLLVAAAAEVRFGLEVMTKVTEQAIPFLGEWQGNKVLLLEFPHHDIPFASDKLTAWLLARNIVPLIAHPERNRAVLDTPSKLKPFIRQGCLLQVTAGSLVGKFGSVVRKMATELLEQDLITVLASDAHNECYRPPIITDGFKAAAAIIGDKAAWRLVHDNPWQIAQCHFAA